MTGRERGVVLFGVFNVLLIAGCVMVQTGPKALEKRVRAFWHARETGTYTFTYGGKQVDLYNAFLAEETRKQVTQQQYYGRINLKVTNPRIERIEYHTDGKRATVAIRFDTTFQIAKLKNIRISETWIVENGQWVLLDNPMHNPFRSGQ
ncbi:MAG: hypothetical protein CO090_00190 [Acidobacteria bacterium CG_4_9_14_3_um_filter_49_7]|nr:MAG: hypothetical protein CO090_00190 [Acidobacteria bacterium CG_4_9_14_3_um_filter_49_7]